MSSRINVKVNPVICRYLQNEKRDQLAGIEKNFNKIIVIEDDLDFSVEDVSIRCYNTEGKLVQV